MLNRNTLARPYAEAIFGIADESNTLDEWSVFLDAVSEIAPDLMTIISGASGVCKVLLLLDSLSNTILSNQQVFFLRLLLRRGRFDCLPAIRSLFEDMACQRRSVVPVIVKSGFAVSSEDEATIVGFMERELLSNIKVSFEIDPRVIGGCLVHVYDDCYDASVLGRLEKLATRLGV